MTAPTFSILTPSYNYAQFIGDALISTEKQSVRAQHVVVDGASTDATTEVLGASENPDLQWISEPDLGQSDALNKALALATGEWIGWLNADEFYLPGAIEAIAEAIARDPGLDVIAGDAVFVDADAKFDRLFCHHRFSPAVLREYGCYLLTSSVFFRRSVLLDAPWDVELKTIMDWDLYLALTAANRRFGTIDRPLSAFRVHGAQVTAEPLPADDPEYQRVRARYGIADRALGRRVGRARHIGLRVVDGCYLREIKARRTFAGTDMRWWRSDGAPSETDALIRQVSGG